MRAHGIVAERKRRYRRNSGRDELYARFNNGLCSVVPVAPMSCGWVTTHTFVPPQGWLYLAVVLDLYARRVILNCGPKRCMRSP